MSIFSKWEQVPRVVKIFLLKGLILFVAWKLLYLFILPERVLDAPVTNLVARGTTKTLNFFDKSAIYTTTPSTTKVEADGALYTEGDMDIFKGDRKILIIADVCNGLELIVLYIGFIICMPAQLSRKLIFIIGGTALIFIINILRCAALTQIFLRYPQYMDFSHHYLFTTTIYVFIFLLWLIFSKKLTIHAAVEQ